MASSWHKSCPTVSLLSVSCRPCTRREDLRGRRRRPPLCVCVRDRSRSASAPGRVRVCACPRRVDLSTTSRADLSRSLRRDCPRPSGPACVCTCVSARRRADLPPSGRHSKVVRACVRACAAEQICAGMSGQFLANPWTGRRHIKIKFDTENGAHRCGP